MSLLCAGSAPPSAFIVSAMLCVSNAALFHACACAAPGLSQPAAASSASTLAPLPVLRSSLRLRFIRSPISQRRYFTLLLPGASHAAAILHCPRSIRQRRAGSDPPIQAAAAWL